MTVPLGPTPNAKSDPIYQTSVAGLARSLADMKAQQALSESQYNTNYNDVVRRMGWNPAGGADQKGAFDRNQTGPNDYRDAMYTNENDFAGRGSLYSGPYAQSIGEIGLQFGDRKNAADTARQQAADTRTQQLKSYQTEQSTVQDMALMDALSRIASKYAINVENVPGFSVPTGG